MATNPYANKIKLADGTVLMDISGDTVIASKLVSGYTAHSATGAAISGSIPIRTYTDLSVSGVYIKADAGYYAEAAAKAISSIVVPARTGFTLYTDAAASASSDEIAVHLFANRKATVNNIGEVRVSHPNPSGDVFIQDVNDGSSWRKVIDDGEWVATTPTDYGTYYGKVVVSAASILQAAFPVGSLYATEDSLDNPATTLGFGTWTKLAPADLTWNDTEITWATTTGVTDGIYVWKRTA